MNFVFRLGIKCGNNYEIKFFYVKHSTLQNMCNLVLIQTSLHGRRQKMTGKWSHVCVCRQFSSSKFARIRMEYFYRTYGSPLSLFCWTTAHIFGQRLGILFSDYTNRKENLLNWKELLALVISYYRNSGELNTVPLHLSTLLLHCVLTMVLIKSYAPISKHSA